MWLGCHVGTDEMGWPRYDLNLMDMAFYFVIENITLIVIRRNEKLDSH